MEPITLYYDSDMTQPFIVQPTDFSAFNTQASGHHSQTVGIGETAVTFDGYTNQPFSINYSLVQDGTTFARNMPPGGTPSQYIDTTYYIKPDMKIEVYFGPDPNNPATTLKISVKYYVGETILTAFTMGGTYTPISSLFYSLHIGGFKFTSGGVTTYQLGFYVRIDNRTLYISTVSQNYWDGSYEVPDYQSDIPKATAGGHVPQGNITPGREQFVDYCFALDRANASAHGPRLYGVTDSAIDALYTQLWSPDMWTQWKTVKYNLFGGILSWHTLPCTVGVLSSVSRITVNGQPYNLGTNVDILAKDKVKVPFSSDLIPEIFGGFLDYSPYTKAVLYLPFCGIVNIDTNKIMGGRLEVAYYIDVYSGNCIAEVRTIDREGSETIYGQYVGNCAYKFPLSGSDQGGAEIVGSLIHNVGSAAVSAASGNAAGAAGALISQLGTDITAHVHTAQIGSFSGNSAALGDLRVKLVLTRPAFITPQTYRTIEGFSAASDGTVSDYMTENEKTLLIGDIDTTGIAATDTECDMIRNMFQGGVFV